MNSIKFNTGEVLYPSVTWHVFIRLFKCYLVVANYRSIEVFAMQISRKIPLLHRLISSSFTWRLWPSDQPTRLKQTTARFLSRIWQLWGQPPTPGLRFAKGIVSLVQSGKMALRKAVNNSYQSINQKLGVKFRLPDPVLGSVMSSNMSGITSYFPWQRSGQQFKQTGEKNPWRTLSWLLISFKPHLLAEASGQCKEKRDDDWRIAAKNEKTWRLPISAFACAFPASVHVRIVVWRKSRDNLRCCLTEKQTSGTQCSYHSIKSTINTHVIWCPLVGQHHTTTFCFELTPLASLISSEVKKATDKEQRAAGRQKKRGRPESGLT